MTSSSPMFLLSPRPTFRSPAPAPTRRTKPTWSQPIRRLGTLGRCWSTGRAISTSRRSAIPFISRWTRVAVSSNPRPYVDPMSETDPPDHSRVPLPSQLQQAIEAFKGWTNQHLLSEQNNSTITETLYHYTDVRGLKGILEAGQIWFTDYRHLNDPSELTHGIDIARDVAHRIATGADGRVRLFLDYFLDLFRHDNFVPTLEFFIACFSRARDDLGQWRAYADNGRGAAIGLSPSLFAVADAPPPKIGR